VRELIQQVRHGSVRAAGRLISLIEDEPSRLPEMLKGAADWPQPELTLGVTGAPGVGKSTLIDGLVRRWREAEPEWMIGIVAVDPSSMFSGGALLGDRVRMMRHATDPKVFIRSLGNRGHLGGLTLGIHGTLCVLGLLGCRVVMLETVGVGQSEIEVSGVADLTIVILAPGQGDGIQMIKAGLLETADIVVVNQADREGADRLLSELKATLELTQARRHGLPPDVYTTVAASSEGVEELRTGVEGRAKTLASLLEERRRDALYDEVRQAILDAARRRLEQGLQQAGDLRPQIDRLLDGKATIDELVDEMLEPGLYSRQRKRPK
jgi:LAO/AO transport system kinase